MFLHRGVNFKLSFVYALLKKLFFTCIEALVLIADPLSLFLNRSLHYGRMCSWVKRVYSRKALLLYPLTAFLCVKSGYALKSDMSCNCLLDIHDDHQ